MVDGRGATKEISHQTLFIEGNLVGLNNMKDMQEAALGTEMGEPSFYLK